jgi:hypothetical protein
MRYQMWLVALFVCVGMGQVGTAQQKTGGCEPDGAIKFICGMPSPEDLIPIPRSDWVMTSGWIRGGMHLINSRDFSHVQVFPAATTRERWDKATYASCPGPVDPNEKEKFSAHGLAVSPGPARAHTVYLVHHGFRESIEVFEVETSAQPPTVTWVGCVVAPPTVAFNSISPLPGGGFVATNPNRRTTPPPGRDSTNTGEIWEWHPNAGFTIVAGSESHGPNGIEASPDGRWLYVNLWPARKVMRLSRGETPVVTTVIDVPFQPDNIRWQPDGTLLTTGHGGATRERVIECLLKVCADASSVVARIDPKTFTAREILRIPASEKFYSSTSALQVGNEIWIGTVTGDRIARHPLR